MRAALVAAVATILLSHQSEAVTKTIGFSSYGIGADMTIHFTNMCIGATTSIHVSKSPGVGTIVIAIVDDPSKADITLRLTNVAIGTDKSVHISTMGIGAETICLPSTSLGADVSLYLTRDPESADLVVSLPDPLVDKQQFIAALYALGLLDKSLIEMWKMAKTRAYLSRLRGNLSGILDSTQLQRTGLHRLTPEEWEELNALIDTLSQ